MIGAARPTAVNLSWAIRRMLVALDAVGELPVPEQKTALLDEAHRISEEDIVACRDLGRYGAELIPDGATVLTHCNAGALATAGDRRSLRSQNDRLGTVFHIGER